MHFRLVGLLFIILLIHVKQAKAETCGFQIVEPGSSISDNNLTTHDQASFNVMAWYSERCIIVGSSDGLWLYDIEQPDNPTRLVNASIHSVAVSPQGTIAFSMKHQHSVYLLQSGEAIAVMDIAEGQAVTQVSFSEDGERLAVASAEIIDIEGADFLYAPRVQIWDGQQAIADIVTMDEFGVINWMGFSQDNQHLFLNRQRPGYDGNDVEYWDIASGTLVWSYSDLLRGLERRSINDPLVVFTAMMAGNMAALGGLDGYRNWDEYYGTAVHTWDSETRQRLSEIIISRPTDPRRHDDALVAIALNSNGSNLAIAQSDNTIRLWNTADSSQVVEFTVELPEVVQMAFSPDDRLLAILSETAVMIWDVQLMKPYVTLFIR